MLAILSRAVLDCICTISDAHLQHQKKGLHLRADGEEAPKRWFPFAEGPRNCVGKSLAQITLPATLAILLSRFSFRLADEVRPGDHMHVCLCAHQ